MKPLEIWAGVECTLNRVGDNYIDQCEKNGHNGRFSDLELSASLGVKKLRYPCLWEKVAPHDLDKCDWRELDERLTELTRLKLPFIAGLLHHGSGPLYTSLIDPDFPEKFSTYARLFATRYPWVEEYTPINEINTTARFSCLYGHWYPHLKNDTYYLKALINQCKATVLAMREIRRINPKARLIQTEDMGLCQSTEVLEYQRDFENERRWLSFDLLCGKINSSHPLYQYIMEAGIRDEELSWFEENSCRPDVIGLNHYHLSNRFLDHRLELYPEWTHGGNHKHQYADVGAIDSGQVELPSPEAIFQETWDRYHLPLAVTECHTRGPRESQMRWFFEIWQAAERLRTKGVEFEAVTAWSLLGTYDWHNLCTYNENFYEPGVFDLRHSHQKPAETGLSRLIRELAQTGKTSSQIVLSEGTWKTPRRILWGAKHGQFSRLYHHSDVTPILIAGASEALGQAFARVCGARNIHYRLCTQRELDVLCKDSIENIVDVYRPWAIINAACFVRSDESDDERDKKFQESITGATNLAEFCRHKKIKLMNFSSDLIFDGFYSNILEQKVQALYPESLIVRTSSFFGPWDEINFVTKTLKTLISNDEVLAANDTLISPTYVPDLVHECLNLLIDEETGVVHLTNEGEVSFEQFANMAAASAKDIMKINPELIRGVSSSPNDINPVLLNVLEAEKRKHLPALEDALNRYFKDVQVTFDNQQEMRQ